MENVQIQEPATERLLVSKETRGMWSWLVEFLCACALPLLLLPFDILLRVTRNFLRIAATSCQGVARLKFLNSNY